MPSTPAKHREDHKLFYILLSLVLVVWSLYRLVLPQFPVWFDETAGKALIFGLPVWYFLLVTRNPQVWQSFSWSKFEPGFLMGIAFGGIYGFVTSIVFLLNSGGEVQTVNLFLSSKFWTEFALAIFTGFWETLLFFSFIQTMIEHFFAKWTLQKQVLLVTLLFVVFHIPNMILRADAMAIGWQLVLLSCFAVGQSLIFSQTKNSYALVLSHTFWGMVLLTHSL